jgi:hypothetical protein
MDFKRATILAAGAAALAAWFAWAPPAAGPAGARQASTHLPAGQTEIDRNATGEQRAQIALAGQPGERGCDFVSHYLPNGDGTTTEVLSCARAESAHGHPYEAYPTEALESLAHADPDAAAILSLRWRESDTAAAMSMALRAAALAGGDAEPIVAFANAYPEPTAVDDVPVRRTVHVKYVLGTVTQLLGDERHSTPYFEALIRQHSQEPDREIALLRQRAQQLLEEMRQIQLDVVGTSTIGG